MKSVKIKEDYKEETDMEVKCEICKENENEMSSKRELKGKKVHKKCLLLYETTQFYDSLRGSLIIPYFKNLSDKFPSNLLCFLGNLFKNLLTSQNSSKEAAKKITTLLFKKFIFENHEREGTLI